MSHLRYPEDLFKIQRSLLSRYHVTSADAFNLYTAASTTAKRVRSSPQTRMPSNTPSRPRPTSFLSGRGCAAMTSASSCWGR